MSRPALAVLAVVLHGDQVLLVRRRNPPDAGLWGYPGGHVEAGETALAAAARELAEETSVRADPLEHLANLDTILRDADGRLEHHFFLVAVLCRYRGGTPQAGDDATHAAWVPVAQVLSGALPMSRDVDRVLRRALESPQEPGRL
ncbi:MAG: NUDIX hydrolase [Rhodobacteraceae bacterium]|nr:NUDIX hydrolase [Paracoccaceae bacterium]